MFSGKGSKLVAVVLSCCPSQAIRRSSLRPARALHATFAHVVTICSESPTGQPVASQRPLPPVHGPLPPSLGTQPTLVTQPAPLPSSQPSAPEVSLPTRHEPSEAAYVQQVYELQLRGSLLVSY